MKVYHYIIKKKQLLEEMDFLKKLEEGKKYKYCGTMLNTMLNAIYIHWEELR